MADDLCAELQIVTCVFASGSAFAGIGLRRIEKESMIAYIHANNNTRLLKGIPFRIDFVKKL